VTTWRRRKRRRRQRSYVPRGYFETDPTRRSRVGGDALGDALASHGVDVAPADSLAARLHLHGFDTRPSWRPPGGGL
jgi:hypothetical protein